ncbi:MAG: hypothetical protein KY445_11475, partial [Armatimonadetes bacterium]|nr:hypothetical protein [Armatimonadota bacterium]
ATVERPSTLENPNYGTGAVLGETFPEGTTLHQEADDLSPVVGADSAAKLREADINTLTEAKAASDEDLKKAGLSAAKIAKIRES